MNLEKFGKKFRDLYIIHGLPIIMGAFLVHVIIHTITFSDIKGVVFIVGIIILILCWYDEMSYTYADLT